MTLGISDGEARALVARVLDARDSGLPTRAVFTLLTKEGWRVSHGLIGYHEATGRVLRKPGKLPRDVVVRPVASNSNNVMLGDLRVWSLYSIVKRAIQESTKSEIDSVIAQSASTREAAIELRNLVT